MDIEDHVHHATNNDRRIIEDKLRCASGRRNGTTLPETI
jgi:hypothetical protein